MSISNVKEVKVIGGGSALKLFSIMMVLTSPIVTQVSAATNPEVAPPVPMETRGTLELWEYDYPSQGSTQKEWIIHCTIPVPVMTSSSSEVAVRMDSNGYGCKNDEALGFKLQGTASGITVGFFDSKCNDAARYSDDNYQYNIMAPNLTFGPVGTFEPNVPAGSDMGPGLIYWFGKKVNGIDGKLSCVSFWYHSNTGGISGS